MARSLPGDPSELCLPDRPPGEQLVWRAWSFRAGMLDLPVWDITGLDPRGPVVILTHGWSDSRTVMLGSGRVAAALPMVSRLIVWDMPGHGEAPGRCSLGIKESHALGALIERVTESDRPMLLWGFSLGARVSVEAAAENPAVCAVFAEAPYLLPRTPAINVLRLRSLPFRTNLPPALALIGLFNGRGVGFAGSSPRVTLDAAHQTGALLVIHGDVDAVSPIEDGRRLARSARNGAIAEISGGQHSSLWMDPQTSAPSAAALRGFLDSIQAAASSRS